MMIRLKVRVLGALQGRVSGHGLVSRDSNFKLKIAQYVLRNRKWLQSEVGCPFFPNKPRLRVKSHSALLLSSLCYLHEMCSDFLVHFHLNKKELCKIHLCIYCWDALQTVFSGKHAEKESGLQRFIGGGINHRKEHNAGNGTGADSLRVDLTSLCQPRESSGANKDGAHDGGVLRGAEMAQPLHH